MLEFRERNGGRETKREYRMIQLFSIFFSANVRIQITLTPIFAVRFSTNTQQLARPFWSTTQQPISATCMFQGQNNDSACSMEFLFKQDFYQPVNTNKSE